MPRALLVLAAIAIVIYALADCYQAPRFRLAGAPRWLWMLLILALPVMGAVIWLFVSRNAKQPAPVAPDDDPDFLRFLAERARSGNPSGGPARPGSAGTGRDEASADRPDADRPESSSDKREGADGDPA